jgi:hypothetical protein
LAKGMSIRAKVLTAWGVSLFLWVVAPSHAEVRTFINPPHDGYRLDFCQESGAACGERVATAWCRAQGYEYASDWSIANNIGDRMPTRPLDSTRVCNDFQCDGFAEISCGREGRAMRLPNLRTAMRTTVITPDGRGTAHAVMPVEVELLVPGCFQTEPGILLCGTVHEYQHCRTLFAAGRLLGCRAGLAFDGGFASPIAASPAEYDLSLHSRARATVHRHRRGEGRLRGDADFKITFAIPAAQTAAQTCLQRDRYLYYPSGPDGGSSEIGATSDCARQIEASIVPHGDDLLSAYDLCEARQAWGESTEGSIELLVAALFYLQAKPAPGSSSADSVTRIVAPYTTIRAPLEISCRN